MRISTVLPKKVIVLLRMIGVLWIISRLSDIAATFTQHSIHRQFSNRLNKATNPMSLTMIDALFSEPTKTKILPKVDEVFDKNGKKFVAGGVVRVSVSGLQQYQIPPKGLGHFDSNKVFVPDTSIDKTRKKCFALPVGIRGVVAKIYNVDEVSANFPVQVKFEVGKYLEEGYDPPTNFIMHFMSHEIECV
jgi:hypothetical protein